MTNSQSLCVPPDIVPGSGQTSDYLPGNIEIGQNKCQSWCQNSCHMNLPDHTYQYISQEICQITCRTICRNMSEYMSHVVDIRICLSVSPSFAGRLWKALLKPWPCRVRRAMSDAGATQAFWDSARTTKIHGSGKIPCVTLKVVYTGTQGILVNFSGDTVVLHIIIVSEF